MSSGSENMTDIIAIPGWLVVIIGLTMIETGVCLSRHDMRCIDEMNPVAKLIFVAIVMVLLIAGCFISVVGVVPYIDLIGKCFSSIRVVP